MKDIKQFAQELSDAYSTNNYAGGWSASIKMLRRRGYNDQQIEAIIRSKWTRWAGDVSNKMYGKVTSADLARFLDDPRNQITPRAIDELVQSTF